MAGDLKSIILHSLPSHLQNQITALQEKVTVNILTINKCVYLLKCTTKTILCGIRDDVMHFHKTREQHLHSVFYVYAS